MRRTRGDGSTVTGVNSGGRGTRLGSIASFVGDGLLALAIAIAGAIAAAGATSSVPAKALLVLLAFATALSLAVRRVYPVAVFAIVVAVTAFFGWVYGGYWPFAALLAFYSVAAHSPRRRALVAGFVGFAFLALPIAQDIEWQPVTWSKVALYAGRLAPLVAAWVLGDNMRTRREYFRALEERAAQLEREQQANARRAAAEEQARIAREVHDVVAHNLSVIIVQATAADAVFTSDPDDAQRAVRTIGTTARQALDELRRVLGVVRTGEERSPGFPPQPSLAQLDTLVGQVRAAGLAVELETSGEPHELPSALELSVYRIVQEALTNTLRHGDARHATVRLRYDTDAVDVEIVDDGTSSTANGGSGQGLIGMRERAAAFGGRVEAGPDAAGGFRVAARLPLAPVER
jgi:signal transduction histidine kinase